MQTQLQRRGTGLARPLFCFLLALLMLVNCLPVAYALSADDVGLSFTGAELLDTIDMSTEDMADIVYVIKVTSEDGSFSANISGNYTFNGAVFLADTTNPDAPCDYISDGLTESGKALHVSMENAPKPSSATIDAFTYFYNSETFPNQWYGKHVAWIDAPLNDGNDSSIYLDFLVYSEQTTTVKKDGLKAALDAVPTEGYYTENDRYNGKTTSKKGFWLDMQAIVAAAQAVYDLEGAGQSAVDAAAKTLDQDDPNSELSKAIANLIPTSQVNPTGLHETLLRYSALIEKEYSTNSWAVFYRKRTDAQNLYDSLFTKDAEGNVTATEENSSAKHPQETVDALVKELQDAAKNLKTRVWSTLEPGSANALAGIALYAGYYDTLNEADYTPESWQAYRSARADALNTAKEHGTFTTTMGVDEVDLQSQAFNKVRKAYFSLVPAKEQITVRVSLSDELSAKRPTGLAHRVIPRTQKLTVPTGTTIGDLLTTSFKNRKVWWVNSMSQLMVYVNGTLAFGSGSGEYFLDYPQASEYQAFKLHDGDEVTVVRVKMPTMVNISEDLWPMALGRVTDKIRYQTLTTDLQKDETTGAYKAVVGVPFTLTATSKAAMPAHMTDDEAKPTAGAYVFRSMIVDDYESVVNAEVLTDTKLKTGADGTLTMTVYQPGWQLINVYNLDSDDAAFVNGGAILIYASVDESQADLTKIKNDLRAELKKTYENPDYPNECFTEADWQTIETLYQTGMDGIDAAEDAASAYAAQLTAKSGIESLQSKAADTNAKNLANFRALMKRFPEDLTKLDASAVNLIDQLESYYNAMTQYQRDELSVQETKRYNAILAAREGLAAGGSKSYTLTVAYDLSAVPEEDKAGLEAMIKWLQEHRVVDGTNGTTGGTMMAGLFTFNKVDAGQTKVNYEQVTTVDVGTDVYFCANPTYATYFQIRGARKDDKDGHALTDASVKTNFPNLVPGNDYAITDTDAAWRIEDHWVKGTNTTEVPHFYVNGNEYELRGITFSGLAEEDIADRSLDTFDWSDYGTDVKASRILRSFKYFTMPYDNVVATVTWVPAGGSADEITSAKDSALAAAKTALDGYGTEHPKYEQIYAAYEAGIEKIKNAKTVEAVGEARRIVLKNMANAANSVTTGNEIAGWEYGSGEYWGKTGFAPGEQIGSVTISVQNYTNDGSKAEGDSKAALEHFYRPEDDYWYEEKNFPLGANDTMMTVLLRALTEKDCTWRGTGGNGGDYDFDITYISTITEDGYSLAEFTGGQQSGWMGTLNDWFTNEGFANFSVKNGKLADGDVISIKYTSVGLGEDIGGTWGNSNTTLKSLTLSGEGNPRLTTTFEPGKQGGTYTYTLVIDGESSNLTLVPTAANKNFLVKTFLNEKVTSNAEGSSFYKRTESIPVVAGDTIYIGCGLRDWPSMNNQAGNTQSNDGTWYILRVISASGSYQLVQERLADLPDSDSIDYTSYEKYEKEIDEAEAAFKSLDTEQQDQVNADAVDNLNKLVEKVQSYRKLKAFKATIKALPRPADATLDHMEAIRAAQREFEEIQLDPDLRDSLSVAETKKMNELIETIDNLLWQDAIDKIDAIGEVTKDSGEAIAAAKAAVSRLTEKQLETFPKDKLEKLAEAEKKYRELMEGKPSKPGSSGTVTRPVSPNKPKPEPAKADASKFRDVSSSDWYFDAVQYVLEKGLMNGTSDWTFAPNDATTRGMIVTILARVEGVNTNGNPWYAAGQKWAMQNDISDGTNMPGVITREQLATILFRYARMKGYDVSKSAALTGFVDSDKVSSYAFDAMQWAVAEELLKGSNGKLDPQGSATRAQVATILMRFMQKYEK